MCVKKIVSPGKFQTRMNHNPFDEHVNMITRIDVSMKKMLNLDRLIFAVVDIWHKQYFRMSWPFRYFIKTVLLPCFTHPRLSLHSIFICDNRKCL